MDIALSPLRDRVTHVRALIDALYEDVDETARAIVADGWPLKMARAGLMLHRRTWNVDALCEALERELAGWGGLAALDTWSDLGGANPSRRRLRAPTQMIHVWPALPGAGLTPVLLGMLLGARQVVRPSGRGAYFAQHIHTLSQRASHHSSPPSMALAFGSPEPAWRQAEVIIASGSDETLTALRDFLKPPSPHRSKPLLLGYGHRVSFALIVDDGTDATLNQADAVALDAVMWHQLGCFSARAVVFCGAHPRAIAFTEALGAAIARQERALDAARHDVATLAQRAQVRGVAELLGQRLHGEGIGWAQLVNTPWTGEAPSPHALGVHPISDVTQLAQVVRLPPHQLQGAALFAPRPMRNASLDALCALGVTRICAPGMLQSPPPDWSHDGWPNMLDFLTVCSEDRDALQ